MEVRCGGGGRGRVYLRNPAEDSSVRVVQMDLQGQRYSTQKLFFKNRMFGSRDACETIPMSLVYYIPNPNGPNPQPKTNLNHLGSRSQDLQCLGMSSRHDPDTWSPVRTQTSKLQTFVK